MSTGKIELSVGAMKIVDKDEIFTEEEIDAINNKIPELDERVGVIEDEIDEINSSLDNMATYITPLMFGAKGDGVSDDNKALQECLGYNGDDRAIIDLGGRTYYTSKTLKFVRQSKHIKNGTIICDGNVFERGNEYTAGLNFDNVHIESKNGYAIYCDKTLPGAGIYKSTFVNCKFYGKLGGFKAEQNVECFANTFIRCTAKSELGNGFEGIRAPGTTMIDIDHRGIENGALFKNCFCEIIGVDSNGYLKTGIEIDWFNNTVIKITNGNFEHLKEKGIDCKTNGIRFDISNTSFTKIVDTSLRVNTECINLSGFSSFACKDLSMVNFDDAEYHIKCIGYGFFNYQARGNYLLHNNSLPINKMIMLPLSFVGTISVNKIDEDGCDSLILKSSQPITEFDNPLFANTILKNNYLPITLVGDKLIETRNKNLGNHYEIKDSSIRQINGIKNLYSTDFGDGTILSIKNSTPNTVNLMNMSYVGWYFKFKENKTYELESNQVVIFVYKNKIFYELI